MGLVYDEVSGHLGRAHPMADGTMFGYVNVPGGTGADVKITGLQFTISYGLDQPNEEYEFLNGTFRDRCADGKQSHAVCPARCVISNTSAPSSLNPETAFAQGIGWQLWQKPLSGGSVAVLVLNRDVDGLSVKLNLTELGVDVDGASAGIQIRDLYERRDVAVAKDGKYTTKVVGRHDSLMFKLTPLLD